MVGCTPVSHLQERRYCKMKDAISEVEFIDIFADNLRDIMEDAKIGQRELAKEAHLTRETINRYLNKKTMPSLRALINICYVLNCDLYDILPACNMIE